MTRRPTTKKPEPATSAGAIAPLKQIRDGVVLTEHLDEGDYILSTLREIERDVRAYVEALPADKREREVMREIMPGVGCEKRIDALLCRIHGMHDRRTARRAIEWAMLAVQAHEHVLAKSVEPEIDQGHRVMNGRSVGGLKTAEAKRKEIAERDKHLVTTAKQLVGQKMPEHRLVGHMIDNDQSAGLSDDTLRQILQAAGVIKKRKPARS